MFASELVAQIVKLETAVMNKDIVIVTDNDVELVVKEVTTGDDGEVVIKVE